MNVRLFSKSHTFRAKVRLQWKSPSFPGRPIRQKSNRTNKGEVKSDWERKSQQREKSEPWLPVGFISEMMQSDWGGKSGTLREKSHTKQGKPHRARKVTQSEESHTARPVEGVPLSRGP